jgi:hypothetical protein
MTKGKGGAFQGLRGVAGGGMQLYKDDTTYRENEKPE